MAFDTTSKCTPIYPRNAGTVYEFWIMVVDQVETGLKPLTQCGSCVVRSTSLENLVRRSELENEVSF